LVRLTPACRCGRARGLLAQGGDCDTLCARSRTGASSAAVLALLAFSADQFVADVGTSSNGPSNDCSQAPLKARLAARLSVVCMALIDPAYTTVPTRAPAPAVMPMANAPQKVTRIAPGNTRAPPRHPGARGRAARFPDTKTIRPAAGVMAVTRRGIADPTAKLAAGENAA